MDLNRFPTASFRLGATSYVLPADLVTNARRLSGKVEVMQLVLFQTEQGNNFPSRAEIMALQQISAESGLRYIVHLPLDIGSPMALEQARTVIQLTRPLKPEAWITHLDGMPLLHGMPAVAWRQRMRRAQAELLALVPDPAFIALENVERWDPDNFTPLLEQFPTSLCVDIGHFLLQERDPFPYIEHWLPRTKVIHLHGVIDGIDHRPLNDRTYLSKIWSFLIQVTFNGVLILEVFETDFFQFYEAISSAAYHRILQVKACTQSFVSNT